MNAKMMVCDESRQVRHGVFSVGAIIAPLDEVPGIERRWREAKAELGISEKRVVHYAMHWPDRERQRPQLIKVAGQLPLRALIALLEDSRSSRAREDKRMRSDSFIQCRAFEYVLQRFAMPLYTAPGEGTHMVIFHRRDDIAEFEQVYESSYKNGWTFPSRDPMLGPSRVSSLRERGFSASLTTASKGPLVEIVDLLVSAITRWADGRAAAHRGKKVSELSELDSDARSLIDLFPVGVPDTPPRRRGYSVITHREKRFANEVLRDNIDTWAADIQSELFLPVGTTPIWQGDDDDIPF